MIPAVPESTPRPLVIACIEDHPKAMIVLRIAARRAQERGGKWRAVYLETPSRINQAEDGSQARMLRLLTLAKQMGGDAVHLETESMEKGLAGLLEKEADRIGLVVIGSNESEKLFKGLRTPPWMQLVRLASQHTQVEVVPLSGQYYHRSLAEKLRLRSIRPIYVLYALLAVGAAFLGADLLEWELPPALFRINDQNVALLFMIACAFVAGRFGLLPGLLASIASSLCVNYYFVPPYHELNLGTFTDTLNMALFLSAALLISLFASQTRGYAQKAAQRELSTQALFTLYRTASDSFSREQALEKLQTKLERMLDVDVAFFLPSALKPERIESAFPAGLTMEEADHRALDACWLEMKTTGLAAPFNPGTKWRFEPMISPVGEIGVIGIRGRGRTRLDAWFGRLLTAIADQTASVLEHIDLERSMEATRLREEREKLRSMLLSSVSHDFKTPLAGIIGALSVFRSLGERLAPEKRDELIEAAIEEAQRLDSFITNILDMTRLESGNIRFHSEWHSIGDMIESVAKRLRHRLRQHTLVVHPLPAGVEACMDIMMTEQVLQNILDNACKYAPAGTEIEISCRIENGQGLICEVRDHGPGLPEEKLGRVFDKYARLQKQDTQVAGTGLGLAISKAVMETQGGWVTAANHPGGGAVFALCLPQWRQTTIEPMGGVPDVPFEQAYSRY